MKGAFAMGRLKKELFWARIFLLRERKRGGGREGEGRRLERGGIERELNPTYLVDSLLLAVVGAGLDSSIFFSSSSSSFLLAEDIFSLLEMTCDISFSISLP